MCLARISRALLLGCLLWAPLAAQSEAALLQRLERNRTDLGAHTRLYQLYLKQGRQADADRVFLRALNAIPPLAISPPGTAPALAFGDFYLAFGKLDQAMQQYQAGMADKPGDKLTYLKRQIEVLMRQGKGSEAGELGAQILRESPNDYDARGLAASLLLDKGDVSGALTEFQALAVAAPENRVIHYNLGRAYATRGEWEAAKREFNRAIELRPDYVSARLALAQLQVAGGEFEAAWKTAGAVLDSDGGNTIARLIQASALMGQKRFGESRLVLEEMLKADPGSADAYYQLGSLNLAEQKYPAAEATFRRAYQLNPANTRALMGMVETAMAQNKTDAALALLQSEVDKAPNRADLQLALGNTAMRAFHYDLAIASFQKALNQAEKGSASQGDRYMRLGDAYRGKGDAAAAIQALQKARETLPNNVLVLTMLAQVLDGAGRQSESVEAYGVILKLDPNNALTMNNFAFLLAETGGDLDRALTLAQRAKELLPNVSAISDTLGWIYLKKTMADKAIEIFHDLVEKEPKYTTYHYHLAMAYQMKGDQAAALAEARAAADTHPSKEESEKIQALIAELGGGK